MPEVFTLFDLHQIVLMKLLSFAFLGFGILGIWRRWGYTYFLLLIGAALALGYFFLVHGTWTTLWGIAADEITITAMYETFAHRSFFSDFSYHTLPPFYPPLFFGLFALPGRIFNWNGVQMAKLGAMTTLALFPIGIYYIQKIHWKRTKKLPETYNHTPGMLAIFLAPLLTMLMIDWDAMITKPYELVGAACAVIWCTSLMIDMRAKRYAWRRLVVYGICGGFIGMIYYLWLVIGAIGLALSGLWIEKKEQWSFYRSLLLIASIALVTGAPYLAPLIHAYIVHGTENWQLGFMTAQGIALHAPFWTLFSWRGLLLLFGFVSMLFFRQVVYVRSLLLLFIATYIWQFMGLCTVFFFNSPMQEFKGFDFFDRTILAFGAAYGIEQLWHHLQHRFRERKNWQFGAKVLALTFFATFSLFGVFSDHPKILETRVTNRSLQPSETELIAFLEKNNQERQHPLTLDAGLTKIRAFVPINSVVYFNQHNSHPAANFSARKEYVESLSRARGAEEFFRLTETSPAGAIQRLILYRYPKMSLDYYPLYFHLDNFPHGMREDVIEIPMRLIAPPYFIKVFENDDFVVWEVQR